MTSATTLRFASGVLRLLIVLNIVFLLLAVIIGTGSFLLEQRLAGWLVERGTSAPKAMIEAMRTVLGLAIGAVYPTHLILTRLLAMVRSVGNGAAFAPENALRLKTIAWALLALQLIDIVIGWVASRVEEYPGWSPSVIGWLSVLLLFVLAQVFEQGAAMREELDATV